MGLLRSHDRTCPRPFAKATHKISLSPTLLERSTTTTAATTATRTTLSPPSRRQSTNRQDAGMLPSHLCDRDSLSSGVQASNPISNLYPTHIPLRQTESQILPNEAKARSSTEAKPTYPAMDSFEDGKHYQVTKTYLTSASCVGLCMRRGKGFGAWWADFGWSYRYNAKRRHWRKTRIGI